VKKLTSLDHIEASVTTLPSCRKLGSIAAALDFCSGAEIDDAQVPYTAAASSLPQTNTTMTPRSARSVQIPDRNEHRSVAQIQIREARASRPGDAVDRPDADLDVPGGGPEHGVAPCGDDALDVIGRLRGEGGGKAHHPRADAGAVVSAGVDHALHRVHALAQHEEG